MSAFEWQDQDLVLHLYVQPKASRDSFAGLHGDELKLAITAPPVDGKANEHIRKYLAKQCRIAKSQVLIEKGGLGRHKKVRLCGPLTPPPDWDWLTG
ncbi:DUF167 family protein YggU [Gallaecimonas pentaromativorans]|uniref:UPF0235 protein EDC28_101369 n=1 Tax=Gallaecimonas pentaromativorans TaxID=584787 RepID=A0A3N1PQ99_9GAMM|nr:DUF167 family protein YggU [Gallaecimonas pentaromativorans]ROQ30683.1 hypothetical protein EDC28_101369 [Gallaecimonas pentaromativorans]